MFSIRRREGLTATHCQLKTTYSFVLQFSLSCHHWAVHFHLGAQWQTATYLCYAAVSVQRRLFCVHFTVFCSCLFTDCVYLISNCCFCPASEYQLSHMKKYTCIHADKNLATFSMPPIYFPVALKGCNSLRACFRHIGTSIEQKFFKSSIVFKKNIKFRLIIYRIFVISLYFPFNQNSIQSAK